MLVGARVVGFLGAETEEAAAAVRPYIQNLDQVLKLVREASKSTVNPVSFFTPEPRSTELETTAEATERYTTVNNTDVQAAPDHDDHDAADADAGAQPSITQEESASQTQREQVAEDCAHSDEEEGHDSHTTTDKTPAAPPPKDQAKPPNLPNGPRLWQKFLSNCYNASIATDIYNNLPTKREKHNFLGFSHPLSAAWLTAVPADYTALPNDVFNECLAVRLGVPVTRVEHACGCEHLKISKEPGYIAPTVTSASALQHAHSTLFEDGRHYNNTRHTKIKEIFTGELSTLLGYENIVAEKGDQNYTDKAGSKTRLENHGNFYKNSVNPGSFMCADLFVRLGQLNLALDVNVAFAGGSREAPSLVGKGFGTVRGGVADHNTDLKHSAYKNLYNFDPKLLQPITFETNGCPSKATTAFLAAVKKFVRNAGTTKQKNMVGTSLRRLAIKTSSSLQRSVGSAIVAYRRVCQKGAGSEGA